MLNHLDSLNSKFSYKRDGGRDAWRILSDARGWSGDCEDYALTAIWLASNESWYKFWWNLLTLKFVIWYVTINGEGHVVTRYKGQWFDNIQRTLVPKSSLVGYKFLFPMIAPIIALKMIIS
jgi:hypothetical protein